jgi:hypothetical protein
MAGFLDYFGWVFGHGTSITLLGVGNDGTDGGRPGTLPNELSMIR